MEQPKIVGKLEGLMGTWGLAFKWDEGGVQVPGTAIGYPDMEFAFEAINIGPSRVLLKQHGDASYRVSVYRADVLTYQTIPTDDLYLAIYLANCLTMNLRMRQ